MINILCFFIFLFIGYTGNCYSSNFYVDPVNGSMSNDGSAEHPWSTMKEVWDGCKIQTQEYVPPYNAESPATVSKCPDGPVHAGDTIYLLSGYHGELSIIGAVNADWITVKAAPGATPKFRGISLRSASKWIFDGLSISTSHYEPFSKRETALFNVENHSWTGPSSYITLENSKVFSVDSIVGWTDQDWINNASPGIYSSALYTVFYNNYIENVAGGIVIGGGSHSRVAYNTVNNSSMDGVRIVGSDYVKFEYNTVKNIYTVLPYAQYHYDLIQAWTVSPTYIMTGVEIRGNIFIAHEAANQPYTSEVVQGMGFFDGWFNDFTIENNLVLNRQAHGISMYGAHGSKIINNTVANNLGEAVGEVRVYPHRTDGSGAGNIVRNNIAKLIDCETVTTVDHNIANYVSSDHFTNPSALDFRLKKNSTAINAGSAELSPVIDLNKHVRDPQPDIGAYEHYYQHLRIKADGKFLRAEQ